MGKGPQCPLLFFIEIEVDKVMANEKTDETNDVVESEEVWFKVWPLITITDAYGAGKHAEPGGEPFECDERTMLRLISIKAVETEELRDARLRMEEIEEENKRKLEDAKAKLGL